MRGKHLGAGGGGDEPVPGDGDIAYEGGSDGLLLLPAGEVHGAGEGRHHDELGEGDAGLEGHVDSGVEGGGLIRGEAEDEGAEDMDAVLLEGLELTGEGFAGVVEVFEDGLEAFGGDGFDADEGSLDIGLAHGVEVLSVFAGLHGDLGEEDHVPGELGELGHELEALLADGGELFEFGGIVLFAGKAEVGEGDRVEVVVGQGDEAEAATAEVDDLVDDGLELTLAGLLAVCAPDGAEGAVLGTAADGLDGGPHVLVAGHEVPAGGEELGALDASAVVDFLEGCSGENVGDDLAPGDIAIAFDDGVGVAALEGFFGEEGGVDAAVDDRCAAFVGEAAYFVAAESVAGVDADAYDVAGLDGGGVDLLDGLVDEDGVAGGAWRGGGKDEEPARGDDSRAKCIVTGIDKVNAHWNRNRLSSCEYGGLQSVLSQEESGAWPRQGLTAGRESSRWPIVVHHTEPVENWRCVRNGGNQP